MLSAVQRLFRRQAAHTSGVAAAPSTDDVVEMLGELGAACVRSTMATNDVEESLSALASHFGRQGILVFVLPTLVIVEDSSASPERVKIFPVVGNAFRLDQAGAVERLIGDAMSGGLAPSEIVAQLRQIRDSTPRFGPVLTILGHGVLTLGFGLVLNPAPVAIPAYFMMGVLVGVLLFIGRKLSTFQFVLPVIIPFFVTALVMLILRSAGPTEIVRVVAPALMSFLPGLPLTISIVELTRGQVVAGASRLLSGCAQLGLLAFGVFAAFVVFGGMKRTETEPSGVGWWAAWIGVILVGVGYYIFSSAPRKSLLWILYALCVAYLAQFVGSLLVGSELSSAIGTVVVVPAVYLVASFKSAPAPAVMLTCAYWLMVPGALGFLGMSQLESGSGGSTDSLLKTGLTLLSMAIGIVIGLGISRDTSKLVQRVRATHGQARLGGV